MKSHKILVTGAAGGIGSVLVPHLATAGHEIFCLDDTSSGSWENIKDQKNIHKITGSILNLGLIQELPWEEFTHVIHLAAISSLPTCQSNPALAFSTNVQGSAIITDIARKRGNKLNLFINASTSAVYESNSDYILDERLEVNPHLVYPQTKKIIEDYLSAMWQDYGFPSISFRFFNVFGPMQDYARKSPPLLNYIVREALKGSRPILHANGEQSRDYISVEDICSGISVALETTFSKYENFNLCSGQTFSVKEIVEIVNSTLLIDVNPEFRSAEMLWNSYDDLFLGKYPLYKTSVKSETLKSSLGTSNKYSSLTKWHPSSDQKSLLSSTVLKAKDHILKTS